MMPCPRFSLRKSLSLAIILPSGRRPQRLMMRNRILNYQHFLTRLLQATVATFVAGFCTASTGIADNWFRRSIASLICCTFECV